MKRTIYAYYACIIIIVALPFMACKTKPAAPQEEPGLSPSAELVFTGLQADDVEHLKAFCSLVVKAPSGSRAKIESWRIEIDGQDAGFAFGLNYPQGGLKPEFTPETPLPLVLDIDIAALAAKGFAPKDDYIITFIADLDVNTGQGPPVRVVASETINFPGVREPLFNITSIAIIKAELINTRFRVGLRIDNPNPYPLELSNFVYELYGNGRLWADGTEKNVFAVNGKSSVQGDLYLIMNFINMERSLLNQIINLVDVNYHFKGEVLVSTGIDYLPKFSTGFDLSGYSEVLEK
jgi:LEA14-like dessication related protein